MSLGLGFWLKKVIAFWLMPLSVGIILGLIGLWLLFRHQLRWAKRLLVASLVWIALVSYAPVGDWLLAPLERQYSRLDTVPDNVQHILLLGGDRKHRAWEAIRLYQKMPSATIITSGYSMHDTVSDAQKAATLLQEAGVKPEAIIMETQVKDTIEEAIAIQKRLGDQPFLLVTSAYHMPRAMKIFESMGVHPIPAPGDFNDPNEDGVTSILRGKQLRKTEKAVHEYIGLLWLEVKSLL